jgi:hypothetical protein
LKRCSYRLNLKLAFDLSLVQLVLQFELRKICRLEFGLVAQ